MYILYINFSKQYITVERMKRNFLPKILSVGKATDDSLFFEMSEIRFTAKTES